MVGSRRTHDYPHGKPFPLVLLSIAMGCLVLLWVFFVPGHWPRAVGIIFAVLLIAFIDSKLHSRYERTGLAVRIPHRRVTTKFSHGVPLPMLAARLAFFATVAMMIVFGFAPLRDSTAKAGIIACVFGLIGVAVLNLALEHHYVNTGVAAMVVGVEGRVHDIHVVRSLDVALDQKAIEVVQQWKFLPARMNGLPVPVQINVELNFHLH